MLSIRREKERYIDRQTEINRNRNQLALKRDFNYLQEGIVKLKSSNWSVMIRCYLIRTIILTRERKREREKDRKRERFRKQK